MALGPVTRRGLLWHGNTLRRYFSTKIESDSKYFCVVGSGPAGFYTADRILRRFGEGARVDIVDALPTPFGLVRSGVAPDHPETKNVIHQFTNLVSNDPRVSFYGAVRLGQDVQLDELRKRYHAVVLAYGAESDRHLDIPGEDLPGVLSAREFVWWYNGHPAHKALPIDLLSVRSVAVVGLGNVALDCARILLQDPERLATTDITDAALCTLRPSAVKEVHIIGRRGPVQASFTPKELRELLGLPGLEVQLHPAGVLEHVGLESEVELAGSRIKKRVLEILKKAGNSLDGKSSDDTKKQLHLHFLSAPKSIESTQQSSGALELTLEQQSLQVSPVTGELLPVGTAKLETLPVQLILKSIGYRSLAVSGLPFDTRRGVVPNRMGQVLQIASPTPPPAADDSIVPGLFVCGWLGRGPTGIIGTNLIDAEQTVESMVRARDGWSTPEQGPGIKGLLEQRGVDYVSWEGWQGIDAAEIAAGEPQGKPREKMVDLDAMMVYKAAPSFLEEKKEKTSG